MTLSYGFTKDSCNSKLMVQRFCGVALDNIYERFVVPDYGRILLRSVDSGKDVGMKKGYSR